jgi:predicted nucleic acid-binding Zn ribbon protein
VNSKGYKEFQRFGSKHFVPPEPAQSVTEVRDAYERLRAWIEFANLLPAPPLPQEDDQESIWDKTDERRAWERQLRAIPPLQFVRAYERCRAAHAEAITAIIDLDRVGADPEPATGFLNLAIEVARSLSTLARASLPETLAAIGPAPLMVRIMPEPPSVASADIWIFNGVVTTRWAELFAEFLKTLDGVEARCFRQCPVCGRVFFAIRKDQKACSKRCNAVRRVRQWRKNQDRHEYRRKLRSAGLVPPGRPKKSK